MVLTTHFITHAGGHGHILENVVHHVGMIPKRGLVLFPLANLFLHRLKRLRRFETGRTRGQPSFAIEAIGLYFVLCLVSTYDVVCLRIALLLE